MKKNLNKIPPALMAKLRTMKTDLIVVGCARKFSHQDIASGGLSHLGVNMGPATIIVPKQQLPPATQGKYSDRNVNGEIIIRRDLPLETHYNSIESPNWGDSYNGTHTVDLPYKAYPREFNPPRELEIQMECLNPSIKAGEYAIAFKVESVLDKKAKDFEKRLLESLNLLQENIGTCGIEAAGTSLDTYFNSLKVLWELLPPGSKNTVLQRLFLGKKPSQQQQDVASERYDVFEKLKAKQLVVGNSGFRRYFGALLEQNLVVFENIEYGNAVYVLFGDWKQLSQKSRVELLSGQFGRDFERIVHNDGWKDKLTKLVSSKRKP